MKKVSNKYVNYGIILALLGVLLFSLLMGTMEGLEGNEKKGIDFEKIKKHIAELSQYMQQKKDEEKI